MRLVFATLLTILTAIAVSAQDRPTLFIAPTEDGFETYLSAAMMKKEVPVTLVTRVDGATYILKASAVEIRQESTGSKVARCLFA